MRLRVLGTAAGGGYPQWDCACRSCSVARAAGAVRTHDAIAISGDGAHWHLVNASPDVARQVEAGPPLWPGPGTRQTPLRSVLLTDAELDHCLGLLALRSSAGLDVYATPAVLDGLAAGLSIPRVLSTFGGWRWHRVQPGVTIELEGGVLARPFSLGGRRPRFVPCPGAHWVVGWRLWQPGGAGAVVYAPCLPRWTDEAEQELGDALDVLVDGTFWSETEMAATGVGDRTASDMGHLPMTETLARLAALPSRRKLYVHLNNTNPVLDDGPERRRLTELGIGIGEDGLEWET